MTRWSVSTGDILDHVADGLICSANPSLNLSGGVGGALLLRFGPDMQRRLHDQLRESGRRHVEPGAAVVCPPFGSGYLAVAHAVAIDAFYDTSAAMIVAAYKDAIAKLTQASCRTIVAACLGCGYGRCPTSEFLLAIKDLIASEFPNLDSVRLVTTNSELADAISSLHGVEVE